MTIRELQALNEEQVRLYQKQKEAINRYLDENPSLFLLPESTFEEELDEEGEERFMIDLEDSPYTWVEIDQICGVQTVKAIGIKRTIVDGKTYDYLYYAPEGMALFDSIPLQDVVLSSLGDVIDLIINIETREQ